MVLVFFANESPLHVLQVLLNSALGSADDFSLTLFYSTSLLFTGLSVAIAFQGGLFNIGAEGQLTMAALMTVVCAPFLAFAEGPVGVLLLVLVGMFSGALWAGISGWIKVFRGGHEVVVTMMLNFLAAGASTYLIVGPLHNPQSQNPESIPLAAGLTLRSIDPITRLFPTSPVNSSFLLAIFLCIFSWWLLRRTVVGYKLRATGTNETAARLHGISTDKFRLFVMMVSGAIASGAAINEVLGNSGKFKIGFSADFGFVGIAVALLARNNPLAVIPSALLFGVLQKGTGDLDLETQNITRDFSRVMQAVIILSVTIVASMNWEWAFASLKRKFSKQKSES